MRYFFYKSFFWITVALTALFGTFFTGFLLGAFGMNEVHEGIAKTKSDAKSGPILT